MSSVDLDDTPSAPPATEDVQDMEPSAPAADIHDTLPTMTENIVPIVVAEKEQEQEQDQEQEENNTDNQETTLDEIPLDDDDDDDDDTPSAPIAPPADDVVPLPSPTSHRTDEPQPSEEMKTSPSTSTTPPPPTPRIGIKVPPLDQREIEFYGQLYRALDYGDTDSVSYDDVNTFLKRSKLPETTLSEAWSLSRKGKKKQAPKKQLYREQFFVCLKLIALAQHHCSTEGGRHVSLLQLCQTEPATSLVRLPLPNFGLRACAAAEALVPRSEVDRANKRASDLNEPRGGLSVHLPKHDTTDHTSYVVLCSSFFFIFCNYLSHPKKNVVALLFSFFFFLFLIAQIPSHNEC